ncbi:hypothetical protein LSUE1_G008844 [Lachnellula suecica]|uniref:Uncharacterized protein n=1 Tax=Lachnellula suecica TaxID=602035 RepID=A0A8T9C0L0_9HELO|nr:hypothetical protein LSUE1_G008844 [Lachnellula suecica]
MASAVARRRSQALPRSTRVHPISSPNVSSPRTKPSISYAEPSSDTDALEDDSDNSDELAEPSTGRRTSSRRSAGSRVQPRRSSHRLRAYQSDNSEDSEDELLDDAPSHVRPSRSSARNATATRSRKSTVETAQHRPKRSRPQIRYPADGSDSELPNIKRRKLTRPPSPKSPKSTSTSSTNYVISSGVIPKWQSLPYHVLLQVFKYAAFPLYDVRTFQPSPSATWLLQMARLCREFTEAALTALYCSPPLVPMVQAHRLVDILRADPRTMAFGYRQKIESLHIDVGQVVAYSLTGSGHLDLGDLIKYLPRLVDLELYHQLDMPPYRKLDEHIKWTYPQGLFDALEYVDPAADPMRGDKTSICKLRSWRWSSRLAGKKYSIENMRDVHLKPTFSNLRKLSFVNYQIPVQGKDEEDPNHEKILADSLEPLTNLDTLVFESSTLFNKKLLPMLPKNVRHLELINCWEVVAEDLAEFLLTHGSRLRTLILNHNQSLNLAFLPVLGLACPHLEVFKMNLTYFNLHATYRDSEPQYTQLLHPEQVPVWPSTLRTIELIQLRKWQPTATEEMAAAEMFFQSLLDSAATLTGLRKLSLQCIISIPWRDRAAFREKWIGSLNRVFLRVSPDPPDHATLLDKASESTPVVLVTPARRRSLPTIETSPASSSQSLPSQARRSQRMTAQPVYAESDVSDAETEILSSSPVKRPNGLARELAILKQTAGIDSPPDAPSSPVGGASSDDDEPIVRKIKGKGKAEVVQGMCEVVEVRIDNLRPTENQATEADFLDTEVSGDEDWNGVDEDFD